MRVVILLVGLSVGLYFIIADRLKIPYLKASKAIMNMGRTDRKLTTAVEALLMDLSIKTDPNGFYLGRDRYGSNIIVDFDRRAEDKTNSNILILGNSGQGKSYLLKLILINLLEAGKNIICLDPEHEYEDLCNNLGGYFVDLMSGKYT